MKHIPLRVMLWGEEIGRLAWDVDRHTTYFTFNPDVIGSNLDIAPLVASTTSPRARIPIFGYEDKLYQKLPSFLADSLPDDWGNQLFEHWRISQRLFNA